MTSFIFHIDNRKSTILLPRCMPRGGMSVVNLNEKFRSILVCRFISSCFAAMFYHGTCFSLWDASICIENLRTVTVFCSLRCFNADTCALSRARASIMRFFIAYSKLEGRLGILAVYGVGRRARVPAARRRLTGLTIIGCDLF